MNYHTIKKDDMLNGFGLRVVLFVSGCDQHCNGCHNPETWDLNSGKAFTRNTLSEIINELNKNYISGITITGGEPLKYENLSVIYDIVKEVKEKFPMKTIWLYTGYKLEINDFDCSVDTCWDNGLLRNHILSKCDFVCDGKFIKSLSDINYPWVGSTNQRVIDVKKSIIENKIININEK